MGQLINRLLAWHNMTWWEKILAEERVQVLVERGLMVISYPVYFMVRCELAVQAGQVIQLS